MSNFWRWLILRKIIVIGCVFCLALLTPDHPNPRNLHGLPRFIPHPIQDPSPYFQGNQAPPHHADLLHFHASSLNLRSSEGHLLSPPTWTAPSLWNSPPASMRHCSDLQTLKAKLKPDLCKSNLPVLLLSKSFILFLIIFVALALCLWCSCKVSLNIFKSAYR